MGGARSKASKGVVDFRPYVTRSIPVGARIVCADTVSYTHLTLPTILLV